MAINNLLNIGRNSLAAYRGAIEIASNNAANSSVPGFSRRRGELKSLGLGRGRQVSAGVTLGDPKRVIDTLASSAVRRSLGQQAGLESRTAVLETVESVIAPGEGGIGDRVDDLLEAFSRLSSSPGGYPERTAVLAAADALATNIRDTRGQLTKLQPPLSSLVGDQVLEINKLSQALADVNRQILGAESGQSESADLRDERDSLIDRFAELAGAQAIEQKDGSVTVSLPGGQVLVSADRAAEMTSDQDAVTGTVQLKLTPPGGETAITIDTGAVGGALSGIVTARDEDIGANIRTLDEYAFGLAQAVNDLHVQGFGLDGTSGRRLFGELTTVDGAASRIDVDAAVAGNPDAIAATRDSSLLPGGSDLILELAGLRDTKVASLNDRTIIQSVNDFQTGIGRVLDTTRGNLSSADAEVETLSSIREATRGVSLDEELADLMKFQRSFEAASRVVRTADEMMTTVLQLKS